MKILNFKKSNDNTAGTKKPKPPVIEFTGSYAKDVIALQKKWGLTDLQNHTWDTSAMSFTAAINGAISTTMLSLSAVIKHKDAMLTSACVAMINTIFTAMRKMGKDEAVFILTRMEEEVGEIEALWNRNNK